MKIKHPFEKTHTPSESALKERQEAWFIAQAFALNYATEALRSKNERDKKRFQEKQSVASGIAAAILNMGASS